MKGKAMRAMGFSDLFQEGNGKSLQLLSVAGPFFTIVVLSKRSPIVESSALLQVRKVSLFNHLRLERRLRYTLHWMRRRRGAKMLRITRRANGEVVFKVSGQLTAENVTEMVALIAAERKGKRIVLDCADLRSVDGEAVKFLERWEADSIKVKNCNLYIRERIRRERLERKSGKSLET
jgi:ABC-type transporter Mla MlaB component